MRVREKWKSFLHRLKWLLFFLKWPLIGLLKVIFVQVPVFVFALFFFLFRTLVVVRPFSSVYENFIRWYEATVGKLLRLEIEGRENLPEGAFIAAARHRSIEDIGLVMSAISSREVVFLARDDLRRLTIIPYVENYTIFIDRNDPNLSTLREARSLLSSGDVLAIFPEGSRKKELKKIGTGVLRLAKMAEVPIVPINLKTQGPYALRETTFKKVLLHLRDLLLFRIRAEVRIGEPVTLSKLKADYEKKRGKAATYRDRNLAQFLMKNFVDQV